MCQNDKAILRCVLVRFVDVSLTDIMLARYKQVSPTLLTTDCMFICKVTWGWPRP